MKLCWQSSIIQCHSGIWPRTHEQSRPAFIFVFSSSPGMGGRGLLLHDFIDHLERRLAHSSLSRNVQQIQCPSKWLFTWFPGSFCIVWRAHSNSLLFKIIFCSAWAGESSPRPSILGSSLPLTTAQACVCLPYTQPWWDLAAFIFFFF